MDKNKVRKALEDSPEPTPGYLYNEFAQWTFKGVSTQTELVNYLFDRLQRSHTSAFVLYKALHIVKLLCEMAHPDFQREVRRTPRSEVIRRLTTYRGVHDVKYADAWNEKVRLEAREALATIFTDFSTQQHQRAAQSLAAAQSPQASGFGSSGGPVMGDTGFHTGMPSANASGFRYGGGGDGGIGMYAGIESHIGEMPQTNKWAEHMARMQNDPDYARRARRGDSASDGGSLLAQISRTAKASLSAFAQHESLRMNANAPSLRPGAPGYESSYARRLPMSELSPEMDMRGSGFEPITLSSAAPSLEESAQGQATHLGDDVSVGAARLPSSGVKRWEAGSAADATTASSFAFIRRPPSPSPAASPPPSATAGEPVASSPASVIDTLVHSHMVAPSHTLGRVELSEFVAEAVQLASQSTQLASPSNAGGTHAPVKSRDALDAVFADDLFTPAAAAPPSSRSSGSNEDEEAAFVWQRLALCMNDHLESTQHSWRVRLNVLACLEALLKASSASVSAFLMSAADSASSAPLSPARVAALLTMGQSTVRGHFTRADDGGESDEERGDGGSGASRVRACATDVHATLKEKAIKVLALLELPLVAPRRAVSRQVVSSAVAATAAEPRAGGGGATAAATALDDLFTTGPTPTTEGDLFAGVQLTRRRAGKNAEKAAPRAQDRPDVGFVQRDPRDDSAEAAPAPDALGAVLGRPRRAPLAQVASPDNALFASVADNVHESSSSHGRAPRAPDTAHGAGSALDDLFAADTSAPPPLPSTAVAGEPAKAGLSSLREAQASLEVLLASLQQRHEVGGAAAPSAEELLHAQQLLQQQRAALRQRKDTSAPSLPMAWDSVAPAEVVDGGAAVPLASHTAFQSGESSAPSRAQVANKQLAAVQAEMRAKYTQ